jgi:hypothetical protein
MTEPTAGDRQEPVPARLRCDTCGRATSTVSRVVIAPGYNRANAQPLYNCPECYERKNRERRGSPDPPA